MVPRSQTAGRERDGIVKRLLAPLRNLWAREARANTVPRPVCECYLELDDPRRTGAQRLHAEVQDTSLPAWARLLALVEEAERDGREVFSPAADLPPEDWARIVELPAGIGHLKQVKHLVLYGSSLVRIPPEIGEMSALEEFSPYTSYRLHWLPYEITRCTALVESTISTRATYGNRKTDMPIPSLSQDHPGVPAACSLCGSAFGGRAPIQRWVRKVVATDFVPLLAHLCSEACVQALPEPASADGSVQTPE